jgi:hypothetical protein
MRALGPEAYEIWLASPRAWLLTQSTAFGALSARFATRAEASPRRAERLLKRKARDAEVARISNLVMAQSMLQTNDAQTLALPAVRPLGF